MDTHDKRASAVNISMPWRGLLPQPNALIGQGDRAQVAFMYRGFGDEAAPEDGAGLNFTGMVCNTGYLLNR